MKKVRDLTKIFRKYQNKWVALTDDDKVISYGSNPEEVLRKSEKKGYSDPVITKIPDTRYSYIF